MPSLLDDINRARREAGEEEHRIRLSRRALDLGRGLGRGAVDAPLGLLESASRLGQRLDRAAGVEGGAATRGIARLRELNRRLWGETRTTEDTVGDIAGSLLGFGGIYRQAGRGLQGAANLPAVSRIAQGTGRGSGLARGTQRLAGATGFWGSRAREAVAGAPLTAIMDAPERETSTAYALGSLLDDSRYGDAIGEALLEASESPLGRAGTGVALDLLGDVALSGTINRARRGAFTAESGPRRGRSRREPRLARQRELEDVVEVGAEEAGQIASTTPSPALASAASLEQQALDAERRVLELAEEMKTPRQRQAEQSAAVRREQKARLEEAQATAERLRARADEAASFVSLGGDQRTDRGTAAIDRPGVTPIEVLWDANYNALSPRPSSAGVPEADPMDVLMEANFGRAVEGGYGSLSASDPITQSMFQAEVPGAVLRPEFPVTSQTEPRWLRDVERSANAMEVGPGTFNMPRRPPDLQEPNRYAEPIGPTSARSVRPEEREDAIMRSILGEVDRGAGLPVAGQAAFGDYGPMLEDVERVSAMPRTDDVRLTPEDAARIESTPLEVPLSEPFVRPFDEPAPGPGARTLPGPPDPRTLDDREIARRVHELAARLRDATAQATATGRFDRFEFASLRGQLKALQDEWGRRGNELFETLDRTTRMPVVDDVRVTPEEQAAVRGRQVLNVPTSEPYIPELRTERRLLPPFREAEPAVPAAEKKRRSRKRLVPEAVAKPDSPVDASAPEGTTRVDEAQSEAVPMAQATPEAAPLPVQQAADEAPVGEVAERALQESVEVETAGLDSMVAEARAAMEAADERLAQRSTAAVRSKGNLEEVQQAYNNEIESIVAEFTERSGLPRDQAENALLETPASTAGDEALPGQVDPSWWATLSPEDKARHRAEWDEGYAASLEWAASKPLDPSFEGIPEGSTIELRQTGVQRADAAGNDITTQAVVSRNTIPGERQWRVTRITADGEPLAHSHFDTWQQAVNDANAWGFTPVSAVTPATVDLPPAAGGEIDVAAIYSQNGADAARAVLEDLDDKALRKLARTFDKNAAKSQKRQRWLDAVVNGLAAKQESDAALREVTDRLDARAEPEVAAAEGEAAVVEAPPVRPASVPVGVTFEFNGRMYIRTPKGLREQNQFGKPRGKVIPHAQAELMYREASDSVYRDHRVRARGIKDGTLLLERALQLARLAGRLTDEGAASAPVARKEAQAFADEVVERGLDAGVGAGVLDEVRSIDQTGVAPDVRVRTASGIALAAALSNPQSLSAATGAVVGGASSDEEEGGVGAGVLLGAAVGVGLGGRALVRNGVARRALDGIGFAAPEAGVRGNPVRAFLRRNFTSTGDLPPDAFRAKVVGHGWIESQVRDVSYTVRDFDRAAREAYGGVDRMTDAEIEAVDDALKGQVALDDLPEAMRPVVARMRNHIDALSRRLIEDGVVQGRLAATIEAGMGVYAKRSYRVFDDPDWAKNVPQDVKNRAVAYLRAEYPNAPEEEIQGVLSELLFRADDGPIAMLQQRKLGSKAMRTLTARQDIHPAIRALWGEYGEASINYAKSVASMSQLIGNHQILTAARESGLGRWLFERPVVRDGQQYAVQIAADGSRAMAPLNGLYTTPEIRDAFEQAFESSTSHAFLRAYMKANGAVKISKTVLSPQSQIRNLVGNTGFAIANGHLRGDRMVDAFRTLLADLGASDATNFRNRYRRMLELGVVGTGTTEGELRDIVKDASRRGIASLSGPFLSVPQRALRGSMATYRAADDLWKIFAFDNEVSRYRAAYPDMPLEQIEQRAAEVVRNTYPNYDMVPNAVKMLRRIPLVGTFVSFPAEVVRVGYNTIGQAARELADPATRRIGLQRAAGILAAATLTSAAAITTRQLVGITPEEEDDMRRFLPPWSKHAQFFHLGKDDRGNRRFINMGYTDPYSYLKEPVIALLNGDDWEKSLTESAWLLAEPFFGEEILAGRLIDISRNKKKQTGGQVFNEQAPLPDRFADQLAYVAEAFEPGVITSGRRIYMGATGEMTPSGRTFNLGDEVTSFATGQRREAVDVRQSLRFKARDYQKSLTEANRIINSTLTDRSNVDSGEISESYADTEQARRRLFEAMHRDAQAAIRLGLQPQEVFQMLRQANVSREMAALVMNGVYVPYRPSDQFIESAAASVAMAAATPEERARGLTDLRERVGTLGRLYQQEMRETYERRQ